MDVGIEDLVTSFSNPNYGLGCAELRVHESANQQRDSEVHCSNVSHQGAEATREESGARGGEVVEQIDTENGAIETWRRESPSSGDSAISSPTTESCLASPVAEVVSNKNNETTSEVLKLRFDEQSGNEKDKGKDSNLENCSKVSSGLESEHRVSTEADGSARTISGNLENSEAHTQLILPAGWKKCDDSEGSYYWHVKSGTLQREPPEGSRYESINKPNSDPENSVSGNDEHAKKINPVTEPDVVQSTEQRQQRHESPSSVSASSSNAELNTEYPIRYAVRSLGWVEISEHELTQERSSRAVNKAIMDLSAGRRDFNDAVGRWGDGKYLYMDVDQENLSLISPSDLTVLNVQPIRTIRVWGVGRDNGRDFAYVSRDRSSRRYMCHVFRCEQPARNIASTLCEICKRAVAQATSKRVQGGASDASLLRISGTNHDGPVRPMDLPNLVSTNRSEDGSEGAWQHEAAIKYDALLKNSSFPTPMDEPRKVMNCHYLGSIDVAAATGIETLNGAIDVLYARVPAERWLYVDVTISPSTIIIANHESPDEPLVECRVRFLSFLSISMKNIRLCAFIMHTAQDKFDAHVFYCEPSAGALCKTIEAACKLRYQKCLDKTFTGSTLTSPADGNSDTESTSSAKSLRDSIREGVQTVFTSLRRSSNKS